MLNQPPAAYTARAEPSAGTPSADRRRTWRKELSGVCSQKRAHEQTRSMPDNAMNLTPNSVEAAAFEHGRGICEHRHRAFLEARSQLRCDSGLLVEQAEQYAFLCPDSLRSLRTL